MARPKSKVIRDLKYSIEAMDSNLKGVIENIRNIPNSDLLRLEKMVRRINKFIIAST